MTKKEYNQIAVSIRKSRMSALLTEGGWLCDDSEHDNAYRSIEDAVREVVNGLCFLFEKNNNFNKQQFYNAVYKGLK